MKLFSLLLGIMVSCFVSLFLVGGIVALLGIGDLSLHPDRIMALIVVVALILAWMFSVPFLMRCLAGLGLGVFCTYLVILLVWPGMNYEKGLNYLFIVGLIGVVLGGIHSSRRARIWRKP
ncbi:hypothetical protein NJC38_10980 [Pseudomonas sp. 21LCFQ010]|uniref:hypothetical protein n=1 Tax=Pseudomonas sp. 21LCFQ010 TaxID=2957506 RepID=UPI0020969BCD|nr:hypothetical protein [Pseudomonas sp. 21LCFQ010]MCO8162691.1 hypothetical protein [Pseudomonas sp. 21LCFQ010]